MTTRIVSKPDDLRQPIKPTTKDKYVGIEIEFLSGKSFRALAEMVIDGGLDKYVTLKGDGSVDYDDGTCYCHPGSSYVHETNTGPLPGDEDYCCSYCSSEYAGVFSHEMCILVKQSELVKVMKKVGSVLKRAKAFVNDTCGLHVHLDVRNRDASKVFANLVAAQTGLYGLANRDRETNTFCRPLRDDVRFTDSDFDRYRGINKLAVQKFGTMEVRLYHGTVNQTEIVRWSKLLVALADRKQTSNLDVAGLKKVAKTKELKAFINGRLRKRKQELAA